MKVWALFVSQPSFGLSHFKNNDTTNNSPAESDYSLPCLPSDDPPFFECRLDDDGLSHGPGTLSANGRGGSVESTLGNNADVLAGSDLPLPSSPITQPTSEGHACAIRPFPLLHLMLSPSFDAIRDMDDDPGMCIPSRRDR